MERDKLRDRGERAHRLGILINGLLAVIKIAGGASSGSTALLADGYHSLADLATNAVAWFSFRVAARPPDDDHHFGHGKAEAAGGVFVGLVLAAAGVSVLLGALGKSGPVYVGLRAPVAVGVALVSMAANEWLVAVTRRSARELNSASLRALARDNRSDSLTSVLVLVGVGGGLAGWSWAEPATTGLIGLFIAAMGLRSVREGLDVMMDRVADPTLRTRCAEAALAVEGVRGVQRVRMHPLGDRYRADLEVSVDAELTVRAGHEIAHAVERELVALFEEIGQVSVHVNPEERS